MKYSCKICNTGYIKTILQKVNSGSNNRLRNAFRRGSSLQKGDLVIYIFYFLLNVN